VFALVESTAGESEMTRRALRLKTLDLRPFSQNGDLTPIYTSALGALFRGDCLKVLPALADESVDTVFADPPFNLGKRYGAAVNDRKTDDVYLKWCYSWIDECVRTLKQGGSFFLYNIPKWNIRLANYLLDKGLRFRDWIVVDIKLGLPIPGRLYPSHYSLLYFSNGKHKTFRNIRTPIKICRHCGGDVKDYGGHRGAINPKGLNLTDVWDDIPPVRHWNLKSKKRKSNTLSTKLLDRVVSMSTNPGDVVLDPFGGSGTTFAVFESKKRRWIGIEIVSTSVIVERLESKSLNSHRNNDFVED
jgi:site-specific DNA-methyltransferase (adenine-specific)